MGRSLDFPPVRQSVLLGPDTEEIIQLFLLKFQFSVYVNELVKLEKHNLEMARLTDEVSSKSASAFFSKRKLDRNLLS